MPELEIHHINVSQGDCTLIINRDIAALGSEIAKKYSRPAKEEDYLPFAILNKIDLSKTVRKALLIDAGDDVYGEDIAAYLKEQGVANNNDFYTIATHFHADHVGGFRDIFFKNYNTQKKLDQQTVNIAPKYAYDCGDLSEWDNTLTKTIYRSLTSELARRGLTTIKTFKVNETYYNLGDDSSGTPINFYVIGANGIVSEDGFTTTQLVIDPKKSPDQNARSIVLVLEYGDFRYFVGGDIGGTGDTYGGNFIKNKDDRAKNFFSSHPDIETSVTKVLSKIYEKDPTRANTAPGHVCVFSADHHGSASSNDVFLIEIMQPKIVVCSSGVRLGFHWHPTQQLFQRIDSTANYSSNWQEPGNNTNNNPTIPNTVENYYITEMAIDGKYGKGKSATQFTRTYPNGRILGDIIVRPISEVDPSGPHWAGGITIQVYGTGIQTDPSVANITLQANALATNAPLYPIGPYVHSCDKH